MKKNLLLLGILMTAFTSLFIGCNDDDEPKPDEKNPVVAGIEKGELKGQLKENYTLDASKEYKLTGSFTVEEGATLTIPAGTHINTTAAAGKATETYIAVMMGAKIIIQGTATDPVVMSSENANPGDWGGLTICGKAVTTEGQNATAEVGSFKYGGTDKADNSGSINYLIIKGAGAQIDPTHQYNGLSLYAVGSGTVIKNVAIINGSDDGVEFFGGSVSVENFYLENNEDDAIDWTEGWDGTITNSYVKHTISNFSTVVEGDGKNNNPKIVNLTATSTYPGTALQFKNQSGATITGLSLTGYNKTIDMKENGPIENVIIEGKTADLEDNYNGPATVNINGFAWAKASDPVLESISNGILKGSLNSDYTLDANKEYKLTGSFLVNSGATLTIPAGTKILAEAAQGKATETYIAVMMGGKINVQGTAEKPVVMTSTNAEPGDWGGLTICGKAVTTEGENATAEVGNFKYGGTDKADNSGSISYLIIKGAGAQIDPEHQYNGLTMYAVGSGTKVENVAIINGSDDGVEFFGGSVSVENLYLENNEDDAIDWTEGWEGTVTNAYVKHTISNFSTVVEADGVNNNPKIVNLTAVSTTGGTALQFKKQSGATITGLSLTGYKKIVDMKDNGPLTNVKIEGETANPSNTYDKLPTVNIANFVWAGAVASFEELKTGEITSDVTLDPSKVYKLTGAYRVMEGAKLTIPAGTQIIAEAATGKETETFIAIMMGAKVDIQGTATNPVIMTSAAAKPGDWGGLTICGRAETTEGVNATAEVGNFKYGGTNSADNSGSISYLVIKGAGANIDPDHQYNGLTLYTVGSGTTINNIAVINGADDGVEFFGGSVSVQNFYLENNEDDAIDWTEGWNGTVTNAYVKHTIDNFSTVVEADGVNNNPKIVNLTAVSTTGGTALQFKKQSGATLTNVYLDGYTKLVDMKDNGDLSNVIIEGKTATLAGPYQKGKLDISDWKWFK